MCMSLVLQLFASGLNYILRNMFITLTLVDSCNCMAVEQKVVLHSAEKHNLSVFTARRCFSFQKRQRVLKATIHLDISAMVAPPSS